MPTLPAELFQRIITHLADTDQKATLAKLLVLSHDVFEIVGASLYKELVVTRKNARSIYRGFPTPPRSSRRRRYGSDRGITWAEFRHPNHALEWAAHLRSRAIDDSSSRVYAVWPNFDADSDESDDEDSTTSREWSTVRAYPTERSYTRKTLLLDRVKRLHFEELPPWDICQTLCGLSSTFVITGMLELVSVSLRPRAIWKIMDWGDRHREQVHPFLPYLRALPADHLCLQIPTIDHHLQKAYMHERMVPLAHHASRGEVVEDQFTFLRSQLQQFIHDQCRMILGTVKGQDGAAPEMSSSVTIHNIVSDIPRWLTGSSIRIFWRPCSCLDTSVVDKVDDYFCYNHSVGPSNNRVGWTHLREFKYESQHEVNRLELIDLDWTAGHPDAPRDRRAQDGWKDALAGAKRDASFGDWEDTFFDKMISIMSSDETEPCVCCGHKQLTGEQVSTSHHQLFTWALLMSF